MREEGVTKQALLVGASGLVGGKVAILLSAADAEVHIPTRRMLEIMPPGTVQHIADPAEWPGVIAGLVPDVAISCLGTTWNKSGKNEAAFRAVDLDLVLAFAAAAKKAGARHMIAVSSVGASDRSSNFYLRTKGQAEEGLKQLGFERLDILRPGLLIGERGERRFGERIGILLSPFTDMLLHGSHRRYRGINSATVARAIAKLTVGGGSGSFIHENDALTALAG
jgi:uncharacterized protein YbjT (DUF2867 family)